MSEATILMSGELCSCALPPSHLIASDIATGFASDSIAALEFAFERGTLFQRSLLVRPWLCAMLLFVCGIAMVQLIPSVADTSASSVAATAATLSAPASSNSAIANGPLALGIIAALPAITVTAPTAAEWRTIMRRDTVAHMLRRHHVDSTTARRWAHEFVMYGEQLHVNPRLLVAIAYAESEFNPRAYSHAGAIGLMQVVPSRASWREYEPRCGRMTARNLHEPTVNICFGAHIYREFLTRHHGDTDHALAAYNNGSGEMNSYPGRVYASLAMLRR